MNRWKPFVLVLLLLLLVACGGGAETTDVPAEDPPAAEVEAESETAVEGEAAAEDAETADAPEAAEEEMTEGEDAAAEEMAEEDEAMEEGEAAEAGEQDDAAAEEMSEGEETAEETADDAEAGEEEAAEAEEMTDEETAVEEMAEEDAAAESEAPAAQDGDIPAATIINDEGGPVNITGEVSYTNPFFTAGVAAPVIITEDQAGFVDRNEGFLMPPESQTLGQITSDFFTSPFSYNLSLPQVPQGTLRDVDNDDVEETGVQIFAIAYWTNTFGDPFLEERDLYGGGWSTAYASTLVSEDIETDREIVGGKLLIYAPDETQAFPSGFGEDGLLFTEDDPVMSIPAGYSVVLLDEEPFVLDRAANQTIDLIEPEGSALDDYSALSYPEAFNALVDQLSQEYAFTEFKEIDWEALREAYLPRFEEAEANGDSEEYRRALRDFAWEIPDGHIGGPNLIEDFRAATSGGLGFAMRETDDGRTILNFVLEDSPAAVAGMEVGTEIISINGQPVADAIGEAIAFSAPFSTSHFERLQQMRYATRFPLGETVEVTFLNPGADEPETAELETAPETASFGFSSFNQGRTGFELPVEFEILDSGIGYAQIFSFFDNSLLTIQLWERMIQNFNDAQVPVMIIDMRTNGGGSGFLADQMAAYFFNEPLVLGNAGFYDEDLDEFYFDERTEDRFYLPSEDLRYDGEVVILVGPNCASACEFFSYNMTLQDRATIIGQYPTAGLGGSIRRSLMPEGEFFTFTVGRAVDAEGNIHIEGQGVAPDVEVPVIEETLLVDEDTDVVLEAAEEYITALFLGGTINLGAVELGETIEGTVTEEITAVRYIVSVPAGETVSFILSSETPVALSVLDMDENVIAQTDPDTTVGFPNIEVTDGVSFILEVTAPETAEFSLELTSE